MTVVGGYPKNLIDSDVWIVNYKNAYVSNSIIFETLEINLYPLNEQGIEKRSQLLKQ